MEQLKRARRPLRGQLARKSQELTDELRRIVPDRDTVRVKLDIMQKVYEKLQVIDDEISRLLVDEGTDEQQDEDLAAAEEYQEQYHTAKIKGENFLSKSDGHNRDSSPEDRTTVASSATATRRIKTYKLPKIEIRKFNGELTEWIGFWSQFKKIHEDDSLHDSDKFQYLVQSMLPGTRAEKVVRAYPQSADNYPLVVESLKDRFGDKVMLTEVYVRQLLKLVIRNVGTPKNTLGSMYDELESHLRALEILGVTQDMSAAFLYPLVESSLPEDTLRVWQRSAISGYGDEDDDKPVKERLSALMKFLRVEVKGAERLSMVSEGFHDSKERSYRDRVRRDGGIHQQNLPTTAGLHAIQRTLTCCIFCDKAHDSQLCGNAQSMTYNEKKKKILDNKACMSCFKVGHMAKACKSYAKCVVCQKRHATLMCPSLEINKRGSGECKKSSGMEDTPEVNSNLNCSNDVLLQTLKVTIGNGNRKKEVRVLLDSGSQKSYLLENTALQLGLEAGGEVKLCHLLFGGIEKVQRHKTYEIEILKGTKGVPTKFEVLGHDKICGRVPRMKRGPWLSELKEKRVFVNDLGQSDGDIELLIGSDYYAQWLTGNKQCLKNGLIALETQFGWTVSGRLDGCSVEGHNSNMAMQVSSMFVSDASISELWDLEAIAIKDPVEKKTRSEREADVKQYFLKTVTRDGEGRYIVSLPWIDVRPTEIIQNGREVAERRLRSTTNKLLSLGKYHEYDRIFSEWLAEDIIEVVNDDNDERNSYYLPHRAVYKADSQTTPVRPVFDASCKTGRSPSLNELLEKGPNLIELVPTILIRFRQKKIGVISDIRKAFQMIDVNESDRNYLRFLWWEKQNQEKIVVFRHKRVVFGVNCSPFLLAAVIELHLQSVTADKSDCAAELLKSFYVDNCVTSLDTQHDYEQFKEQAMEIMRAAKMDLRNWECSQSTEYDQQQEAEETDNEVSSSEKNKSLWCTKVLGLVWNKKEDTLSCEIALEDNTNTQGLTKRSVLSMINKVFDPIGVTCPAVLPIKIILQNVWVARLSWDEILPEQYRKQVEKWYNELSELREIKMPRCMTSFNTIRQLHTFCDASQEAYAAVSFMRSEDADGTIMVRMVMARSRLAPIKKPSIPRMELLACVIGARMANFIIESFDINLTHCFMWSDSTTALAWIRSNDEWGTFVGNRVKEICRLTDPMTWRHVPGHCNPADLPSRGCSSSRLVQSEWWNGPNWLHDRTEAWPTQELAVDERAIRSELKKSALGNGKDVITTVATMDNKGDPANKDQPWYLRSYNYHHSVRTIAWVRRFIVNCRESRKIQSSNLSKDEYCAAETVMLRLVQQEQFPPEAGNIKGLAVAKNDDGLYYVKTKLIHKRDTEGFRRPVLLPADHPLVVSLINWYHLKSHHAGVQYLMNQLRENFWILKSRRTIKKAIYRCIACLRQQAKSYQTEAAALPPSRVETRNAFETVGVDLAGPLYLKKNEKAWVVLFTCAVYRGVHLDFVTSLSTEAFLSALERFINVRGRPNRIYSDNGSNFVGAVNLFKRINWKTVEEVSAIHRIQWIFNPPTAAWWGGWWERLIGLMKNLMKRMLGNARLNYEQLRTCLSQVENVINERPLTVVSEDLNDLIPLTPVMFMRGVRSAAFPEGQIVQVSLTEDYQKRQSIQRELKERFRKEYLSQLVQKANETKSRQPKVGDVVLVGSDDKRRIQWPLAVIVELIPGRDNVVRTVKLKSQHNNTIIRPIQRLYPLEVTAVDGAEFLLSERPKVNNSEVPVAIQPCEDSDSKPVVITRSGRRVKRPTLDMSMVSDVIGCVNGL